MKINFDSVLKHISGENLKTNGEDLTLKGASIEALIAIAESDRNATGEDKFKRYEIAMKVNAGGEVELTPEEVAVIKKRVGEVFGVAVVGPAYKLLNG